MRSRSERRSTPSVRHLNLYSTCAPGKWCSTTCIMVNLYRSVSSSDWMIMRAHCNLGEMCGRYGRFSRKERIEALVGQAIQGGEALVPRYNVCPGLADWVLRQPRPQAGLRMDPLHWGLLASWTRD